MTPDRLRTLLVLLTLVLEEEPLPRSWPAVVRHAVQAGGRLGQPPRAGEFNALAGTSVQDLFVGTLAVLDDEAPPRPGRRAAARRGRGPRPEGV